MGLEHSPNGRARLRTAPACQAGGRRVVAQQRPSASHHAQSKLVGFIAKALRPGRSVHLSGERTAPCRRASRRRSGALRR
jgi:hypothetical protein